MCDFDETRDDCSKSVMQNVTKIQTTPNHLHPYLGSGSVYPGFYLLFFINFYYFIVYICYTCNLCGCTRQFVYSTECLTWQDCCISLPFIFTKNTVLCMLHSVITHRLSNQIKYSLPSSIKEIESRCYQRFLFSFSCMKTSIND